MNVKRKIVAALGVAVLGFLASNLRASPVSVGDPFVSGSWSMQWHDPEPFSYDAVAISWVSGDKFESLTFSGVSSSDNSPLYLNTGTSRAATLAVAQFGATTDAYWTNNFLGSGGAEIYDWFVYGVGSDTATAAYRVFQGAGGDSDAGSGWSYSIISNPTLSRSAALASTVPVPLPAAAGVGFGMLAGFGSLFGFAKNLRRRRRIA